MRTKRKTRDRGDTQNRPDHAQEAARPILDVVAFSVARVVLCAVVRALIDGWMGSNVLGGGIQYNSCPHVQTTSCFSYWQLSA